MVEKFLKSFLVIALGVIMCLVAQSFFENNFYGSYLCGGISFIIIFILCKALRISD